MEKSVNRITRADRSARRGELIDQMLQFAAKTIMLSDAKWAASSGVSQRTISRMRSGAAVPTDTNLFHLREALIKEGMIRGYHAEFSPLADV